MRRFIIVLAATIAAAVATPAAAQDMQIWSDHAIMAGQGAVLNHMNRENARRLHRRRGLPPPDFRAAERRLHARRAATRRRSTAPPVGTASLATKCAYVRARADRLTTSQMRVYRRACG